MRTKLIFYALFSLALGSMFLLLCHKKQPIEPEIPCINDQPVEDTTRVYLEPISRDTMEIYPPAVFARFYPWVIDTNKIKQIFEKYHLRRNPSIFGITDHQYYAFLCVTDDRRAEYHFTPYGKEGYCNFGADSLVEYSFGVFNDGRNVPWGYINFEFNDDTPQTRIDSLFEEYGLRHIQSSHGWHKTIITPRAKKNVLDLGYELRFIPFVNHVYVSISEPFTGVSPIRCE